MHVVGGSIREKRERDPVCSLFCIYTYNCRYIFIYVVGGVYGEEMDMGGAQLVLRIDPYLRDKFREICSREGETMSRKIRGFIIRYVVEHEKGNPQTKMDVQGSDSTPGPSLLEQVLREDKGFMSPYVEWRKAQLEILEANLNRYPRHPRKVAMAFMRETGLSERKVEEYMRILGRPVILTPQRRRRNY